MSIEIALRGVNPRIMEQGRLLWQNSDRMKVTNRNLVWIVTTLLLLMGLGVSVLAQGAGSQFLPVISRGPASTGNPIVNINFQPAGAEVPPGYLPDSGATYGNRGNGFNYGWNSDNSATTRERNSPLSPDQRYDTFVHLQKPENPDAIWEIALPPGVYDIYAVGGDAQAFDGTMHTLAEGRELINGAPSPERRFVMGIASSVTVTDGRLTIRSGPQAVNNKLNFLEIYQVAVLPTPTPTPPPDTREFRGLWVTRFDWTRATSPAEPAKIDEIVNNAADAGFNAILFQVRGSADAYYAPGLEPWAQRVSGGAYGQQPSPYWDPLGYFVARAHARGLQLHAYINVYPVWDNCTNPPSMVSPTPFYYLLQNAHGTTDGKLNGTQWTTLGQVSCGEYLYASPASPVVRAHVKAVAADLVNRYDIDGIHLDRVRYAGRNTSCDPVSAGRYGAPCFTTTSITYQEWQRQQVNTLVREIYEEIIVPARRGIWLTAAVWPTYQDKWGWGYSQGYHDYYQDSQAWAKNGYIDALAPMIYSYRPPQENPFPLDRWRILAGDFQANRGDRLIIPGIGGIGPGLLTFDDIVARIEAARDLGTAGHAIYSYSALFANGYFDDLAAGPYATPAAVPDITWHD